MTTTLIIAAVGAYLAITALLKRRDIALAANTMRALGSGDLVPAEVSRDGSHYFRRRSAGRTGDRTGYKRCVIFRTRTGDIKAIDSQEHLKSGGYLSNPVGAALVAMLWSWFRRNGRR